MGKNAEFHLSYSRIATYINCPLRYKFIYVDKLPVKERSYFSFGSSIHKVLEVFYHPEKNFINMKEPPFEYMLSLLDKHWISAGYTTKNEEQKAKDKALKVLKRLYQETIFGFHPAYLVEKSFSFHLDKFKVIGRIDRIDYANDGYTIIDYKTNRLVPRFFKVTELLQPVIYYVGAKESLGLKKINNVFLYFVNFNKKVRFDISDEMVEKGKNKIIQVGKAIQREEFYPKPNGSCTSCEFKDICPAFAEDLPKNAL